MNERTLNRIVVILVALGWLPVLIFPNGSFLRFAAILVVGFGLGYMGRITWIAND